MCDCQINRTNNFRVGPNPENRRATPRRTRDNVVYAS